MAKFLFFKNQLGTGILYSLQFYLVSNLVVHIKYHCSSQGDLLRMHGQESQLTAM